VYLFENFETGTATGWTQQTNASDGGWLFGSNLTSSNLFQIPSHTMYAATTDGACNCDKSNDWLISPLIDLSNANHVELKFDAIFGDNYSNFIPSSGTINASIDGGTTWSLLKSLPRANATSNYVYSWNTYVIDISEYAGNNNLQIGFKYNDGNNYSGLGFALDNIEVAEITSDTINVYCQSFYVFENSSASVDQELVYLQSENVIVRSVHDNSGYGSVRYGYYQGWPDPIEGLNSSVTNCSDPMQAALIFTNNGNTNFSRNIKLEFKFSNLVQGVYNFSFDYLFNKTSAADDYVVFKADNNAQQQSIINYSSAWAKFKQDEININSSLMVTIDVTTGSHMYKHLTIDNFLLQRKKPPQSSNLTEANFTQNNFKVYPNPFSSTTTIEFDNHDLDAFSLSVYNIMGSRVRFIDNITNGNYVLEKGNLTPGVYHLELRSDNKTLKGRVVIE